MTNYERTTKRDTTYDEYRETLPEAPTYAGHWLEACKVCSQPVIAVIAHQDGEEPDKARADAMRRVTRKALLPTYFVAYTYDNQDITAFRVRPAGGTTWTVHTPKQFVRWLIDERRDHYAKHHPERYDDLTEEGPIRRVSYQDIVEERAYSLWHRPNSVRRYASPRVADSLVMVDLDYIEVCQRDGAPVALIETAQTVTANQRTPNPCKPARITRFLGLRAGLPVYSLNYLARDGVVHLVRVRREDAEEHLLSEVMTPEECAGWLASLRLDHDLATHTLASAPAS